MSRPIPDKTLRELRDWLHLQAGGQRFAEAIDRALTPKRSAEPRRKRRQARREEWSEKIHGVREGVLARSYGLCEACGHPGHELDEFFGGIGRRRVLASIRTCWFLCIKCHHDKTENRPNARHWAVTLRDHCILHGYTAEASLAMRRFE